MFYCVVMLVVFLLFFADFELFYFYIIYMYTPCGVEGGGAPHDPVDVVVLFFQSK